VKVAGIVASVLATVLVLSLSACTGSLNLKVESEVPVALVSTLPLTIGVFFDERFANYQYVEDSNERRKWDIAIGGAQVAMFERVLGATFEKLEVLSGKPSQDAPIVTELNFVPRVEEMQFATPDETFFPFYEAWIRYEIDLVGGDGSSLEIWNIVAYGKSPKTRFTLQSDGLNKAIELALRDAGAKLSIGATDRPAVRQLLERAE